jgi:hypothetical protein
MKRRLLPVVVLLSCAVLAAVAVLSSGFLAAPVAGRSGAPSPFASDLDAESEQLDRQLQSTDAHRELLQRLSADLIAGRSTLPAAATVLADFSRQRKPEWLRGTGRHYPGWSEEASVAAVLVYYTLFRLRDGNQADEVSARRLAAEYRAGYGRPFTLPADTGAPIPPGRLREEHDGPRQ